MVAASVQLLERTPPPAPPCINVAFNVDAANALIGCTTTNLLFVAAANIETGGLGGVRRNRPDPRQLRQLTGA